MLYDSHNHLHDTSLAPHLDAIAAACAAAGLARCMVNGSCETDWPGVTALARRHAFVSTSYGLHPWDAGNRSPNWLAALRSTLDSNPRAHIGEIGLDRWMLDSARPDDPRLAGLRRAPLDEQIEVFRAQLSLAAARNLAASIHCVSAFGALMQVLETTPLPTRGFLLHAYGGPAETLPRLLELGAYFSFNACLLAGNKHRPRDIFRQIPPARLLVETDAPAMPPPATHRPHVFLPPDEKLNHPANIAAAYEALAALRRAAPAELSRQIAANHKRLFE